MIKDFLISFSDNFKEKTKNPFLGTYFLVWVVRNWELIYTLFNFDSDTSLEEKKSFIFDYYSNNDFLNNLFCNILWSFGLLVLTYLLLNLSRFIVNLSEKRLTPWVYKITDSKSIVLKTEYERIRAENDELQIRLEKERTAKSRLESTIKSLEAEIVEISRVKAETDGEFKSPTRGSGAVNRKVLKNDEDFSIKLLDKIKEKELTKEYLNVCTKINRGDGIPNSYIHKDYFIELGLIKFLQNAMDNSKMYTITSEGEMVLKNLRLE
jgi:hypothetical protein